VKIWAKCMNTFAKSLYVLWFYKNGTQNQSADVFLEVMFLFSFGQVGGNLGRNGAWSALICKKMRPTSKEMRSFFWGPFLWSIFRASLGKFAQKSFAPQKICLLHLWTVMLCARWCKQSVDAYLGRSYQKSCFDEGTSRTAQSLEVLLQRPLFFTNAAKEETDGAVTSTTEPCSTQNSHLFRFLACFFQACLKQISQISRLAVASSPVA